MADLPELAAHTGNPADTVPAGTAAPSVRAVLDLASTRFDAAQLSYGHGTTNARDEAAWLILHALGEAIDDPDALDRVLDRTPDAATLQRIEALIEARIETRKPAAYLTGEAWLVGVPFYIDERAIVPRSLIGELIADAVLDPWLHPESARMLDLCTGNGSLAVLMAMAWPEIAVDALDLSADALEVARRNVARHDLDGRIELRQSDLYAAVDGRRYDAIISNPPYVNSQSMAALPAEYRAEPEMALAGGADGMDLVRGIIAGARRHLQPHGVLVVEIGNEYGNVVQAFPDLPLVWLPTSAGEDQVFLIEYDALPEA